MDSQPTETSFKAGAFTAGISANKKRGWFEHSRQGDEWCGGLDFEDMVLTDYEGVFQLPNVIIDAFIKLGFNMDYALTPAGYSEHEQNLDAALEASGLIENFNEPGEPPAWETT